MATGKLIVAWTISGGSVFGKMWRPMSAASPAPSASAATTNSRLRHSRKLARVSRAKTGRNATPMAIMLVKRPGRKTAARSSADRMAGNPCTASISRMKPSSSHPPKYPDATPSPTPMPMPIPTAMTPTRMAVTEPVMTRERRSRPNWSVPSGCCSDGPWSLPAIDISSGSRGV